MQANAEFDFARRSAALRILFVTPYVPSRLRPRPYYFIRTLAELGHRVDVIAAATSASELAEAELLESASVRVCALRIPPARSAWSCARGILGAAPLQARYCQSPAMTAAVREALAERGNYDVLHVEHLRASLYGLEATAIPRVYDAVDCMSRLHSQTASDGPTRGSRLAARAELGRTRAFERRLLQSF